MAPRLRELVVWSEQPILGDTFVRTLERAALHDRNVQSRARSSTAAPSQAIGKRLKGIAFERIWLSSKSFRSFVRNGASANNAVHSESDDEEGPPLPIHAAAVTAASSTPRATSWAHSLEFITFFNIPPCLHRRETPTQIIYSGQPLERSTCELIQGLGCLTSMRVHNPDAPVDVGPPASLIDLDVTCGRAGLDPFDPQAHRVYVRAMPSTPKVPPKRSVRWHHKEIVGRKNDVIFDPATAEWLADLKAQETKAAATAAKAAAAAAKAAAPPPPPPPLPAPDLRPLEPKNAKGRRVLIPRTIWPEYPCTEQGGSGWAARVTSCSARDGIARVHFESAVDEEGRPYPDEHLRLADLHPL